MAADNVDAITEQFRQFIIAACDTDPGPIVADGRWHRFRISDTRHKASKPGRYLLHTDGKPNGIFMDWRDSQKRHKWFGQGEHVSVDRAEIERRRARKSEADTARFARAAEQAKAFWSTCTRINGASHAYLDAKGIGPHGARYGSGEVFGLGNVQCVIVPISDAEGNAMTVQAIRADGARRFWPDSTHESGHYLIGQDDGESPIVFCEGFSTAASINDATGLPVVMCVNSGNMVAVARWAGHRWHGRQMIVAGDDDWHLVDHPKVKRNVGRESAEAMARNLGGIAIFPEMHGVVTDGGDDFNDMAREIGAADVAELFHQARGIVAPAPETALPLVWYGDIKPILNGNWIVKKVLPADAFVTVIGHPGCGKSFFALDLGAHIGAGREWQGRKTKRGLVVYLAAEGQRGQQNRVEAWRRHYGITDVQFAMIPVAVNLRDRDVDLPKLIETIRAAVAASGHDLAVLVVDTLNRTFGGGDENGSDMSEYVDNVGKLKAEFGCTTIVVHHIPKNAEGTITERGHGSLRGAVDTSLVVSYEQTSGIRTVTCTKMKDAEDGWHIDFKLKSIVLGQDEDGDEVSSCVVTSLDEGEAAPAKREPPVKLTAVQKQVYHELVAAMEVAGGPVPDSIPNDRIDRRRVGKVVPRSLWRDRWEAIGGGDRTHEVAVATFNRAVLHLQNTGLVGVHDGHSWLTFK